MPFFSAWIREGMNVCVCACACTCTRLNGKIQYVLNSYSQFTNTRARIHPYSGRRCGCAYESINVMSSVNDHLFYIPLLTQKCRKVSEKNRTKHERYTKKLFIHIFIRSVVRSFGRSYVFYIHA